MNGELKEDNHLHNIGTRGPEGKRRETFAGVARKRIVGEKPTLP